MYKRWDGWDDVTVCDNCGRKRQEARIYLNRKIDYYVWEREPYEIHKRDKINVNICEVCLAFVEERGKLP